MKQDEERGAIHELTAAVDKVIYDMGALMGQIRD